jgi:hypothetical protein
MNLPMAMLQDCISQLILPINALNEMFGESCLQNGIYVKTVENHCIEKGRHQSKLLRQKLSASKGKLIQSAAIDQEKAPRSIVI